MTTTIRLHITPLRPDLLPTVLGARLLSSAQNISYHAIETFPENSYGFVELPEVDAKKLILKLNGAILKGRTMKVEEARQSKRSRKHAPEIELDVEEQPPAKKVKKSKKDVNVLAGHELEEGRKVKRGWTDSSLEKSKGKKSKDKKEKKVKHQTGSKFTEKDELIFRTTVPPNKQDLDTTKKRSKAKKDNTSPTLVHEFEKTAIQPKFLREAAQIKSKSTEFVDGKGWVDQDGHVIEEEPSTVRRSKQKNPKGLNIDLHPTQDVTTTQKSLIEEANSSPTAEDEEQGHRTRVKPRTLLPDVEDTSSSGTSSSEEDVNTESESEAPQNSSPQIEKALDTPTTPPAVHPLEALFKKPKPGPTNDAAKPSLEIETSFSFFDRTNDEVEDDLPPMPMTPFTSQDINSRNLRSAAPTPDTAHPSRFANFAAALSSRQSSDEGEDPPIATGQDDLQKSNSSLQKPQSEFEKRFWAERGQNNRAWKARSRTARKEQRQNENRLRRTRYGV